MSTERRVMDPSLTRDAGAALDRLVLSRRDWLKGAGCLIVGFSGVGKILTSAAEAAQDLAVPGDQLDSWIAIAITAYTGKCELGQEGQVTAYASVSWGKVSTRLKHS